MVKAGCTRKFDQSQIHSRRDRNPNALHILQAVMLMALTMCCFNPAAAQGVPGAGWAPSTYNWTIDYYNPSAHDQKLRFLIEKFHLVKAKGRIAKGDMTNVWNDIDYTLQHCPNHPEGLRVMSNLAIEHNRLDLANKYFDAAVKFRPTDLSVRILYAIHLHKVGAYNKALDQYKAALAIDPNSVEAHYNLGLLYADMGKFEEAKVHAKQAYELGYPLPGLRNILTKAGYWP